MDLGIICVPAILFPSPSPTCSSPKPLSTGLPLARSPGPGPSEIHSCLKSCDSPHTSTSSTLYCSTVLSSPIHPSLFQNLSISAAEQHAKVGLSAGQWVRRGMRGEVWLGTRLILRPVPGYPGPSEIHSCLKSCDST